MSLRTAVDLDPSLSAALAEVKNRLAGEFGQRFRALILYGSRSRGEATEDSDVDLMLLLEPPVAFGRDLDRAIGASYPILLATGYMLSIHPVPIDLFERQEFEIYRAAKEEGIVV